MPVGSVRRELPDAMSVDWPRWVGYGCAGLMVLLAGVAASDPAVPHRGWLAVAVLLASAGWLAAPLGWWMPPLLHAALVLGIIGAVNAEADPFGFYTVEGHEQLTFLVVIFLVGEASGRWPLRLAVVVAVVAVVLASPPVTAHDEISGVWIGAIGLAALVGILIRALLSTILDLEAAQAELSEQAAVEERHRIAREVHDVIAHSLTVTMLHLTAARLAIGRSDDAAATEALDEAERAGRSSLADVRRTVGLLRSSDGAGFGTAPAVPQAADVAGLVEGYRSAGMPVELVVQGDLGTVPADAGIAVFRTVQEALANAARHTPGARSVVAVGVGPKITVRVRTTGGAPVLQSGAGAGLLGMRERAEALGGWGAARPDGDGWLVEVELPAAPSEALR